MNIPKLLSQLKAERSETSRRLQKLDATIASLTDLAGGGTGRRGPKPGRRVSAATKKKMAAAARKRWAAKKSEKKAEG